jgi:two-component system cell cycle response regulator
LKGNSTGRPEHKDAVIKKLVQENRYLKGLLELSKAAHSTLNSQEILTLALHQIAETVQVHRCSVLKLGKGKDVGYVVATHEDPAIHNLRIDLRKYPEILKAVDTNQAVVVKDTSRDPLMTSVRQFIAPTRIRSIIVVPVLLRGLVIGALLLKSVRTQKTFTRSELGFLQVAAGILAGALYNALVHETIRRENNQLETLAITDGLTEIYNHRYFYIRLDEEFHRASRYHLPLSCMMVDIDGFKTVNDQLGHRRGDEILKKLSALMRATIRKTDLLARYGGEEFAIILPQTDEKGALLQAERIRMAIKRSRLPGLGKKIPLTLSLGVATYPMHAQRSPDELVTKADRALYEAKRQGKDRVASFSAFSKKGDDGRLQG